VTGTCPRCKVERQLTPLPGSDLLRCAWCTLVLRAIEPSTTITRRRAA